MRRSLFAGIGVAAVLIFAACSPDQTRQEPLAPADVGLAKGGVGGGGSQSCSGNLASDIAKNEKLLFAEPGLTTLQNQFTLIKDACPIEQTDPAELALLLNYIETMIENRTPGNAPGLAAHLFSVTQYASPTGTGLVRLSSVFGNNGGAAVLSAGESMTTFDERARLIAGGTAADGLHFYTFTPLPSSDCNATTSLRVTGNCYDIEDFPDGGTYSPPAILTLCLHSSFGESAIGHQRVGPVFNGAAEVLPEPVDAPAFGCVHTASALDGWLGREAGPVGRILARAYDYLRPQPLFADDAGESGSLGFFSIVGGVLNDIFSDNFDDPTDFNDGVDTPDLGDAWTINSTSPGFVQIQDALGGLSGGVVVLSQAQGNCNNCPTFRLLGTRVNSSESESVGTYEVTWQSSQTKPNVKEAPFVVLNAAGAEIARLAYVTQSSTNKLVFTVAKPGPDFVFEVPGGWTQNVPQSFKITVNLTVLGANDNSVSLAVGPLAGPLTTFVTNTTAPNASSLKQVGYVLTGIDAGIIASDNWKVTRLADIP